MEQQDQLQLKIRALEKEIARLHTQIKQQRYGLTWLDVPEAFDNDAETKIPILEEAKDKAIAVSTQPTPPHIIIEGDNYHALTCLNYTHKGKIDIIYIDPPYNTGSDGFTYKDKRVLTQYPDGTPVPREHPLRHSIWLSFMSKRLTLAKNLLSDKGVIFISIDDNEQANLKLLCDKVFGEENLLVQFIVQVRYEDKSINEEKDFKPLVEYILAYAKNSHEFKPNRPTEDYGLEKFIYRIEEVEKGTEININGHNVVVFKKGQWKIEKGDIGNIKGLKETWITGSIYTTMSYGKVFQQVVEPRIKIDGLGCLYKVIGRGDDGLGYRYYTGPQKKTATKGKMFSGVPMSRVVELEKGESTRLRPISNFYDFSADFGNIRHEGGVGFNGGKKPIKMLSQLINYCPNKNAIVLDFFAGSGSTLHATLKCNEDDKGNRQCILVQINENNICEVVTYPRCKNVINNGSLKYYRTAFVGKHTGKDATDEDRVLLSQKAGYLLALSENTLEEIEKTDCYQLFGDGGKLYTAIYFVEDLSAFDVFVDKIAEIQTDTQAKTAVYIFSFGQVDDFRNDFDNLNGITIKSIPDPILNIYKAINEQ